MFMPHVGLRDRLLAEMRAQEAPAGNPLAAAAASATGADGWRSEVLADGRRAAIGIGTSGGRRQVAVLACGDDKRPRLVLWPSDARVLTVKTGDGTWAFPNGAAADALAAGLLDPGDKRLELRIDGNAFPAGSAAIAAFDQTGKDCEQRAGWSYGNDDDKQIVWTYRVTDANSPILVLGKPSSGWLVAELTCDRRSKALVVKSTALPRQAKAGQSASLTVRAGEQDFTAPGRVNLFKEGDVSGFVTAQFAEPRKLLDALGAADSATLSARDAKMSIAVRGLGALLPDFERACGF
jgi:hypothetical protein